LRIKARKMQGKRSLNSVNTPTVRSWEVYWIPAFAGTFV
jgi:hypothetical protein